MEEEKFRFCYETFLSIIPLPAKSSIIKTSNWSNVLRSTTYKECLWDDRCCSNGAQAREKQKGGGDQAGCCNEEEE